MIRSLAGLQCGALGALAGAVWFVLGAVVGGRPWNRVPHLLASSLFHERVLQAGLGRITLYGFALHFATAALAGILFGLLLPRTFYHNRYRGWRFLSICLLAGVAWYWIMHGFLLGSLAPLLEAYSARNTLLYADLLLGVGFTHYWRFLYRLRQ